MQIRIQPFSSMWDDPYHAFFLNANLDPVFLMQIRILDFQNFAQEGNKKFCFYVAANAYMDPC